jgi:hypothetical protein
MKLSYCPNCRLNVVINAEELCPGCHNPIPAVSGEGDLAANRASNETTEASSSGSARPEATIPCPHCSRPVPKLAVLCIHCGYHLKFKRCITTQSDSTVFEAEPIESRSLAFVRDPTPIQPVAAEPSGDSNPYAAPTTQPDQSVVGPDLPLTKRAEKIAQHMRLETSTSNLVALGLLTFCCAILALVAIPAFLFRIGQWHYLNSKYTVLRQPNSLTASGRVAFDFQEARIRLYLALLISVGAPLIASLLYHLVTQSSFD